MDTTAIRSDWAGTVVDQRFTLLQWLGGTDRSGVFLTELEERRTRKGVIKLIPADAVDADARLAGWAAVKTLSHPHLMHLFRTGRCQIGSAELLYVVTEYGEEVLSEVLRKLPLTPLMATEMLEPLVDALSYLHGKGFVHGHVKPSNLMVVDNKLKLSCDSLQLAGRFAKRSQALTIYDAPESATRPLNPPADVWSLGVTLVEALTQHPPAWDPSAGSDPAVPDSVPQPFAEIALACLHRNPSRRPALSDIKARLGPDSSASEKAGKASKPNSAKFRTAALIAAALVPVVVVAVLYVQSHKAHPSLHATPAPEQPHAQAPVTPPSSPAPTPTAESGSAQATSPTPGSVQAPAPAPAPASTVAAAQPPTPTPAPAPVQAPQAFKGAVVKGAVVQRVMPDVAQSASATIQGTVMIAIHVAVDANGAVSDAAFDSPPKSKYFGNLALEASRGWKFQPAQVDGQAVASVWLLRFQFRQTGTDVTPVETSP
jgi:TonB family protein